MPKKAASNKDEDIAGVPEKLIQELKSLSQHEGVDYPPLIVELTRTLDPGLSDDQIQRVIASKLIKENGILIPGKDGKRSSLRSPAYFKADEPKLLVRLRDRLLEVLKTRDIPGTTGEALTLKNLQEACDQRGVDSLARVDSLVIKVAGSKEFTAKVDVEKPEGKKVTLDSRVSLKRDPVATLASRMLAVLDSQKRLGADSYPPTLRRLAELSGKNASDTLVTKTASDKTFTARATVVAKNGKNPSLDAPVALNEDLHARLPSLLPALLRFALEPRPETTAYTLPEVTQKFAAEFREVIAGELGRALDGAAMPAGVGWVMLKGKPLLLLLSSLKTSSPTPSGAGNGRPSAVNATPAPPSHIARRDFASTFRDAFDQLDRRNGSINFVKLADLRRSLSEFSRDEFDAGLKTLRISREFTLDSHEGLAGTLTAEEREAGVREANSLLIYASRSRD